jgi:hypothetical protein
MRPPGLPVSTFQQHSPPGRDLQRGDPSGLVTKIRWKHWGTGVAIGRGLNAIFKPGGGCYPEIPSRDISTACAWRS